MKTLHDLFLNKLAAIYDAERRFSKALPQMANAATRDELRTAFERHSKETEDQVTKIEAVFECFDRNSRAKVCEVCVGLLTEGEAACADFAGSPAINAALISAARKIEHYEIASYGCLHDWALVMGNRKGAALLHDILKEETAANLVLKGLARTSSNKDALGRAGVKGLAFARGTSPWNFG